MGRPLRVHVEPEQVTLGNIDHSFGDRRCVVQVPHVTGDGWARSENKIGDRFEIVPRDGPQSLRDPDLKTPQIRARRGWVSAWRVTSLRW